jgi:hypothetical protein
MSTINAVSAEQALGSVGVGAAIRDVEASLSVLRRELVATGRRDLAVVFGSLALPAHRGLELVRELVADDAPTEGWA